MPIYVLSLTINVSLSNVFAHSLQKRSLKINEAITSKTLVWQHSHVPPGRFTIAVVKLINRLLLGMGVYFLAATGALNGACGPCNTSR